MKEVIGGYFRIPARDPEEAIAIARARLEFESAPDTRTELPPVRMQEEATGFVYPMKGS